MSTKKALIIFLSLLVVFLSVLLWDRFLVYAADQQIKRHFTQQLKTSIKYEKIKYKDGLFTLKNVQLASLENQPLSYSVVVPEVILDPTLNFSKKQLHLDLYFNAPTITLNTILPPIFTSAPQESKFIFFKVDPALYITAAKVELQETEGSRELFEALSISFKKESPKQNYRLTITSPAEKLEKVEVVSYPTSSGLKMELSLSNIDLAKFKTRFIPSLNYCGIEKGELSGKILLQLSKERSSSVEGFLNCENLLCQAGTTSASLSSLQILLKKQEELSDASLPIWQQLARTTLLEVTSPEDSIIRIENATQKPWEIKELLGYLKPLENEKFQYSLTGKLAEANSPSAFTWQGELELKDFAFHSFSSEFRFQKDSELTTSIKTSIVKEETIKVQNHCSNVNLSRINFLLDHAQKFIPELASLKIHQGIFDGQLDLEKSGNQAITTTGQDLLLKEICFDYLGKTFSCKEARGHIYLNHDPLIPKTPSEKFNSTLDLKELVISDLKSNNQIYRGDLNLSVEEGIIQKLAIKGSLFNADLQVALDNSSDNQPIEIEFTGPLKKLVESLPPSMAQNIQSIFEDPAISLKFLAKQTAPAILAYGDLKLKDLDQEKTSIHFELKLGEKTKSSIPFDLHSLDFIVNTCEKILPFDLNKLDDLFKVEGNFNAKNLILEDYLSSLLNNILIEPFEHPETLQKEDDVLQFKGIGDFQGSIRNEALLLNYNIVNLQVDSPYFTIAYDPKAEGIEQIVNGSYRIDLASGQASGLIPIKNVSYLEKYSGLLFQVPEALIRFNSNALELQGPEVFCDNVAFSGNLKLETHTNNKLLLISCDKVEGALKDGFKLLSQLSDSKYWKQPVEGNFNFAKEGLLLKISITPQATDFATYLKGTVSDAAYSPFPKVAIQKLNMQFEYDGLKQKLTLGDLKGELQTPKMAEDELTYSITAKTPVTLFLNDRIDNFDIQLSNPFLAPIRLAGSGSLLKDREENFTLNLSLDPSITHIGHLFPNFSKLTLDEGLSNFSCQLSPTIELSKLSDTLSFLEDIGLIESRNKPWEEPYSWLKSPASGKISTRLSLDSKSSSLIFELSGKDLEIDYRDFSNFYLKGNKNLNTWSIEDLQINHTNFKGNLSILEDQIVLNTLELSSPTYGKLALYGKYFPLQKRLYSNVNWSEIDCNTFKNIKLLPLYEKIIKPYGLFGNLAINGPLNITLSDDYQKIGEINANVKVFLSNFAISDFTLANNPTIVLKTSSEGWSLEGLQAELRSPLSERIACRRLSYDAQKKDFELEELQLFLVPETLKKIINLSKDYIPSDLMANYPNLASFLSEFKVVDGTLHQLNYNKALSFNFSIAPGEYSFLNRKHAIKDFTFQYNQSTNFTSSLLYNYNGVYYPLALEGRKVNPGSDQFHFTGVLKLYDHDEKQESKQSPLKISWEWKQPKGILLDSISGEFLGVKVDLKNDQTNLFTPISTLSGQIQFNPSKMQPLFPARFGPKLEKLALGNGYQLKGVFSFNALKGSDFTFQGQLRGDDFELFNYRLKSLLAKVAISPERIEIRDLSIKDRAGSSSCELITLARSPDSSWSIDLPQLTIESFQPSLADTLDGKTHRIRPLTLKKLTLNDLQGNLTTKVFSGSGEFTFTNYKNKKSINTLFVLPNEIISSIGLNPNVLIPIEGLVQYELEGNKIHLRNLSNSHSMGKKSTFYLENTETSYIDLDGNLNLNIHMKQHNFLFKLAQNYIIQVRGTLGNPSYSLVKASSALPPLK